jgi:hypothetical protein
VFTFRFGSKFDVRSSKFEVLGSSSWFGFGFRFADRTVVERTPSPHEPEPNPNP